MYAHLARPVELLPEPEVSRRLANCPYDRKARASFLHFWSVEAIVPMVSVRTPETPCESFPAIEEMINALYVIVFVF